MNTKQFTILFLYIFCHSFVNGQGQKDWPSSLNFFQVGDSLISIQKCNGVTLKHREVITASFGREYYCSGNFHAEGPIKKVKSDTVTHYSDKGEEALKTEYVRDGYWKTYFDSTVQVVRSEGAFKNGEKEGEWTIYTVDQKPHYEFEFSQGRIKTKVKIDQNGSRETIIQRSDKILFVEENRGLLVLIGLLPVLLGRIGWNILTYNKVNNTSYIPLFQDFQKGGTSVNVYCTFTFWWSIYKDDSKEIASYKRIANWISVLSVICFFLFMIIALVYGEAE